MHVLRRRLRARLALAAAVAWHYRGTVAGSLLALAGMVTVFTRLPTAAALALAAGGVAMSALELTALHGSRRAIVFQPRHSDDYADVVAAEPAGVAVRTALDVGLLYPDESRHISRTSCPFALADREFERRPEFEKWALAFLLYRSRQSELFNGPAIGLASDPPKGEDDRKITLQECRYYDFLTTNILSQYDIYETGHRQVKQGREWFVDRRGQLRRMDSSWLANLIGISTIAFTSDGKLLLVHQSDRNTGSPGLFAPSGSGALEPVDVRESIHLQQALAAGAERELREETGVLPQEIVSTQVIGYGRWISRGAMPEFAAVTLLAVDSHDLEARRVPKDEQLFVARREHVRVTPASEWDAAKPLLILPEHRRTAVSFPLAMALASLARALRDGDLADEGELRRRWSL